MGQNCCASSRIFVQRDIYATFLAKFKTRAERNVLGSPFDGNPFLGPQISGAQHSKILGIIQEAKAEGAVCIAGGKSPYGWFVEPTIFKDVKSTMKIAREEVFGPVVVVAPFDDEGEAIQMANDSCYGLAAGVFTSDIKEAIRITKGVAAGTVWVNCYNAISHQLPFGGYKQSGIGKDLGQASVDEFSQVKTVRVWT
ncbi:hypothetical protein A1O3_03701 [Capronia epimyces CBS 606.96]|uniref:Aldehyde dehydrogenase n=1 Tax=Capronia epimyces CBS 606.96 TaxID=1182542 RepID=W9Y1Q5_9EURO|nr:uncharacterized protein A1O3_03701 [Capronia epimyces CBS 606.96]EXJ86747.1 hypothetical protein A1O3_03701 [Capronia epimyces CBS 606.96]